MRFFARIAMLAVAVSLCGCAPAKPKQSDAELVAKLSNTVPMDSYAKCSAAFGRAAMMHNPVDKKFTWVSSIFLQKAIQLSSIDIATQKLSDDMKQYWAMEQQDQASYLITLKNDILQCNTYAADALK